MSAPRPIARVSTFALVVISWLAFGTLLPVLLPLAPGVRLVEGEVSASPRHMLVVTTPVILSAQPALRLERGVLSLAGSPSVRTSLAGGDGQVQPVIADNGSARLVLEGAHLRLDAETTGSESAAAEQIAPLIEALQGLNFEVLTVRRCTLVVVFGDGHSETLSDIRADLTHKRRGVITAKGTYTLRGLRQSFEVAVGRRIDKKAPPQLPLKLHVTAPEIDLAFDGILDVGSGLFLAGQAELSLANVRQAALWLGASWPRGPGLLELKAKGQLGWTGRDLAFDRATFQMDGNQATGALALNSADARPRLSGTLAFKTLDLTGYLRGAPDEEIGRRLSWASLTGGESPLPLARLVDADVRVSAARVQADALALGRSAATLTLENGKMLADIVEFQFHEGQGSGQITLETMGAKPKLTVLAKLQDVDLARASASAFGHSMLHGRGDISANLIAGGATYPDLLKSLSGKFSASLAEAGRLGIDVRPLLTAGTRGNPETWKSSVRGQMPVEQFDLKVTVANGIAVTENLQASAADLKLAGFGSLNLAERRVDLRLEAEQVAGAPTKKQVLQFNGPFSEPSIRQDEARGHESPPAAPPTERPDKAG